MITKRDELHHDIANILTDQEPHESGERLSNLLDYITKVIVGELKYQAEEIFNSNIDFEFINAMCSELGLASHKGDWKAWQPEAMEIVTAIMHSVDKLERLMRGLPVVNGEGEPETVQTASADIANYAMKAYSTPAEGSKEALARALEKVPKDSDLSSRQENL